MSQWHTMTAQQRVAFDPASASMTGVMIARGGLGALAVKTVTAEYSTGMIRATFTAMPTRPLVLAAKAATVAAFAFPVTLLCNVAGFELGQRIFASQHAQVAIGHPGVVRAMVFGALAVSLTAVIGVGLGGVIRAHGGRGHHSGPDHRRRLTVGQFPAGRLAAVHARHRHPGGRDGPPFGRTAQPRSRAGRARRVRRPGPDGGVPSGIPQRRVTFVPITGLTFLVLSRLLADWVPIAAGPRSVRCGPARLRIRGLRRSRGPRPHAGRTGRRGGATEPDVLSARAGRLALNAAALHALHSRAERRIIMPRTNGALAEDAPWQR